MWAGVVADPPWGVAPLPCSPPFPARSLAIATMRRGDGERQAREGGEGGEKREGRAWQRLVMGVGAGRVRGGCGSGMGIGKAAGRREGWGKSLVPAAGGAAGMGEVPLLVGDGVRGWSARVGEARERK